MKSLELKLLQNIWPFSELKPQELDKLQDVGLIKEYRKGEIIYRQDQEVTALYVLLSGKVVTFTLVEGKEKQLDVLHRGKIFGIISMMTGSTHSVTARALFDTMVFEISKDNFKPMLDKVPELAFYFSRILARRVKSRYGEKEIFESKVICIASPSNPDLNTTFASDLIDVFRDQISKSVKVLEVGQNPAFDAGGRDFQFYKFDSVDRRKWSLVISDLVERYSYVFVIINVVDDDELLKFLSQADTALFLSLRNTASLKKTSLLLKRMVKMFNSQEGELKVVLVDDQDLDIDTVKSILKGEVFGVLGLKDKNPSLYQQTLRRFSRTLADRKVGLVLGSGGALGIAHIGVISVLEEQGIPVDMVCGSSVGALVAALWAAGYTAQELENIAYRFKEKNPFFSIIDINIPTMSIFKGKKFDRMLFELFGERTFQDLARELRVVSFDFWSKKEVVIKEGKLCDAVRASCSFPGFFSPLVKGDAILLDGGILQPLPVSALVAEHIPKIIAVSLSSAYADMSSLKKKRGVFSKLKLNILDFVFGSIESMQAQFVKQASLYADEVIYPRVGDLNWMDMSNVKELIKRGREETEKNIEHIKEIVFHT